MVNPLLLLYFCLCQGCIWAVKNPPASAGGVSLISGSGRSPGGGNSNSLQYSCQGNSMNREAGKAIVHGVAKGVGHDLVTKQQ